MNQDSRDVLLALLDAGARFLVVGAHAMAVHGVPRATGDLDVWVSPDRANSERVWRALLEFGAPVQQLGLSREDLETPGMVIQVGLPPRRIDFLTEATGLVFEEAWQNRTTHVVDSHEVPFVSRQDLVRNKRALGRPKDLADLDVLTRRSPRED